jgi:hypothetical protein
MGLKPAPVSTQVIQRDRHAEFIIYSFNYRSNLEKIAVEIRHLQRTEVLEAEEYFQKDKKVLRQCLIKEILLLAKEYQVLQELRGMQLPR